MDNTFLKSKFIGYEDFKNLQSSSAISREFYKKAEEICTNISTISFWVKFWSISTIIGWIVGLIVIVSI